MNDGHITNEMISGAEILTDVAPEIIAAAELELMLRGVDNPAETIAALFTAAWRHHKDVYGPTKHSAFSALLRDMADSVDRSTKPN